MGLSIATRPSRCFCCGKLTPTAIQVCSYCSSPAMADPIWRCFVNLALKRSRDPAVLATCDIVVDVGAVYDESKQLFDHHQRGFTEVFGHGFTTKLSSAGLVYK